nr:hypothetical protein [Elizabethkingia sp. ASV34]
MLEHPFLNYLLGIEVNTPFQLFFDMYQNNIHNFPYDSLYGYGKFLLHHFL